MGTKKKNNKKKVAVMGFCIFICFVGVCGGGKKIEIGEKKKNIEMVTVIAK